MKIADGITYGAVALAAGALLWWQVGANSASLAVDVKMPELNEELQAGQQLFVKSCASCHGANAGGTGQGPPLIHIYYEPNHHGDAAFYSAVAVGVRQHHWNFGNMPAVKDVNPDQVGKIIAFLRAVQRENGIK